MSMKRSKQKSGAGASRGGDEVASIFYKPPEPEKTWEEATAGQPDEAFAPYSLKNRYAKNALLAHPKFGKGVVTGVEGGTIHVLFSDGKKKLGHTIG